MLQQASGAAAPRRLRIVSATRLDQQDFWKRSALGQSLAIRRSDPRLAFDVACGNTRGLPAVYNEAMARAAPGEALLFVHDDIWLDDPQWVDKLLLALQRFDVVGLAGNRRRVPRQPAWLYLQVDGDKAVLDAPNLSGAVAHGERSNGEVSYFGPSPARCELLDGLFIAVNGGVAKAAGVSFDERFDFHFYDLDFCRTARSAGLSLGTWPIMVTHQSRGSFNNPVWRAGLQRYLAKWRA